MQYHCIIIPLLPNMSKKIGHWIGMIIALLVFITSNNLRYTHDTSHSHSPHHSNKQQLPNSDDCALCWFVSHQVSNNYAFTYALPEAAEQDYSSPQNGQHQIYFPSGATDHKQNKDPPLYL